MKNNYIILHLHTSLSNLYTTMDSITTYKDYILKAKELGMKAIAFSEHGNVCSWVNKKRLCDEHGLKYIHAVEAYVTKDINVKVRDNMHVLLIAKNNSGAEEINKLMSHNHATNRKDNHFYYNPRISMDELISLSKNVIISTACLGGILNSGDKELEDTFIEFLTNNKDRCFLEIQHHLGDQIEYNKKMYKISQEHGIRLLACTDTHSLNSEHVLGVKLLQKAKDIKYNSNEEEFDLTMKSYDELVACYEKQNCLPREVYMDAIHNTNVVSDMVEDLKLDESIKYPKLYDNSVSVLKKRIVEGLEFRREYIKNIPFDIIKDRINTELDTIVKIGAVDFVLLEDYVKTNARSNNKYCGYSRGSCSGSFICYLLGITDIDSIKYDLNFFRFMNPERVSLCDVDSDWYDEDKEWVQHFLLEDDKFNTSYIITYNTIAMKGAIRDVGRGLGIDSGVIDGICKCVNDDDTIGNDIRAKYPDIFKYVDILKGTIVSFGSHPAGVIISDKDIESKFGTITLSASDYPVSCIDMKEVDSLNFVKLDCLGLDNVGVINKCCELAGIDRITPDNVDLEDMDVWRSIIKDSTSIFQWESDSAMAFLKKFMSDETLGRVRNIIPNFSMIKWFSYGNGLIRPACASFRNEVANGVAYDNGLEEINEFLAPTLGRVAMQEDIMMFLVKFCDYSMGEADVVRRGIAKKKGTEQLLPEIERRFIDYSSDKYNVSKEKCKEVIKPFLKTVLDASSYAFSWNHSDSYSIIGYVLGYLRYYYPLEYLTSSLNVFTGKIAKITEITEMAKKMGIVINQPKFRYSRSEYYPDRETKSIYKGLESIKYMNKRVAEEMYELRNNKYNNFLELLVDINNRTTLDARQLKIITKLDFFSEFGKSKKLLDIIEVYDIICTKKQFKKDNLPLGLTEDDFRNITSKETPKMFTDVDVIALANIVINNIPNKSIPVEEIFKAHLEFVGYIDWKDTSYDDKVCIVSDVKSNKWGTPFVTLYRANTGTSMTIKVDKKYFTNKPLNKFDIIKVVTISDKFRKRKQGADWIVLDEKEYVLESYGRVID